MKIYWMLIPVAVLGGLIACGGNDDEPPALVTAEGDAFPFNEGHDKRIDGATITILEYPDREYVTGPDGHFIFEDLEEGTEVTFRLSHPDYTPIQTGTHLLGPEGIERVTFQAVKPGIYAALAALIEIDPDPSLCQMVTTITRTGKSLYDEGAHGEAGALVTLDPPLPAEHGPIYFNELVLPDREVTESSEDGGVLFVNVPEGDYTWTATKPGVEFRPVKMKCRPGFLVNASPPWGLQVTE